MTVLMPKRCAPNFRSKTTCSFQLTRKKRARTLVKSSGHFVTRIGRFVPMTLDEFGFFREGLRRLHSEVGRMYERSDAAKVGAATEGRPYK